jgi:hypothetical protein
VSFEFRANQTGAASFFLPGGKRPV